MHILAIVNQKGGCGKTTTAINLAGVFAGRGYRTLLVDMDPQGHCAAGLAIPENRIDLHIGDAMLAPADQPVDPRRLLWRVSRNLDLAPATVRLAALEAARGELAGQPDAERRLQRCLARFDSQYDVCLIDCSPAIGLLAFNALVAAHEVIIPVETGFFSLQGATKQVSTIKAIGKRLGVAPVHRVLATMHDPTSMLSKDLLEELKRRFTNRLLPVVIRYDQALKEAASFGQPVVEYAPESTGACDYGDLAEWLANNSLGKGVGVPEVEYEPEPEPAAEPTQPDEGPSPAAEPVCTPVVVLPASRTADLVSRARRMHARAGEATAVQPQPPAETPSTLVEMKPAAASTPVPAAPNATQWPAATFGPQVTPYGVIFRVPPGIGRSIAVSGDFNQWSPERTPMSLNRSTGALEAVAFMPPGTTSQYRLVVDGQWIADPYNPCTAPNPFGGTNSVVAVPLMTHAPGMAPPAATNEIPGAARRAAQ